MSMYALIELIPDQTNPQQYLDNYNNEKRDPYSSEFVTAYPLYTIWSFSRNTVLGNYLINHCDSVSSLLAKELIDQTAAYIVVEQRNTYKSMSELRNHMNYTEDSNTFYDLREELDQLRSYLEELEAAAIILNTIEMAMYDNNFSICWG